MKLHPIFFLLLLLGGLALYIQFGQRRPEIPQTIRHAQEQPVLSFKVEDLALLSLELPSGTLTLKKMSEPHPSWKLISPLVDEANESRIQELLNALKTMRIRTTYSQSDLRQSDFSSTPPPVKIRLESSHGEKMTLEWGTENPIDHSLLVRIAGTGTTYKTKSPNLQLDTKTINDFRHPLLILSDSKEFTRVSLLKEENPLIQALRDDSHNGEWIITPLTSQSLSSEEKDHFKSFLNDLFKAKILEYVLDDKSLEDALSEYGLSKPEFEVTITTRTGSSIKLSFSAPLDSQIVSSENRTASISTEKPGIYMVHSDLILPLKQIGLVKKFRASHSKKRSTP